MTMDERLRQVFSDVFDIDRDAVGDEASPDTIEGWDSVAHLNLVLALEGEFMIRFEAEEIPDQTALTARRHNGIEEISVANQYETRRALTAKRPLTVTGRLQYTTVFKGKAVKYFSDSGALAA